MAIIPFLGGSVGAAAGGAGAFFAIVGRLMLAITAIENIGGLGQQLDLPFLRQQALRVAPGAPPVALEEAARWVARMVGLGGDKLFWPRYKSGPNAGKPVPPMYMVLDFTTGEAWITVKKPLTTKRRRSYGRSRGRFQSRMGPAIVNVK